MIETLYRTGIVKSEAHSRASLLGDFASQRTTQGFCVPQNDIG